jgi:hypothetical protein
MNPSIGLIIASSIQVLLAFTFLIAALGSRSYGDKAQKAAEANVAKQGFEPSILLVRGFKIGEAKVNMILALTLALMFGFLGVLNLFAIPLGRTLSLIVHSIFFFIGGYTTAQQVFTAWFTERAFMASGDKQLQAINVKELITAAESQFPKWLRFVIIARFILITLGSMLVARLVVLSN